MNKIDRNREMRGITDIFLDFKLSNPYLFRRKRCKPIDEDLRRKYTYEDDMIFLNRYKALGSNQSTLARELGISQVAVRKRLIRVQRELAKSASKTLTMFNIIFADITSIF